MNKRNKFNFQNVINNIYSFWIEYPEFFEDVLAVTKKYENDRFKLSGYSLNYRNLYRILSEREREPEYISLEEYERMQLDVYNLRIKDPEAFDKFSRLIRKYVVFEEHGLNYSDFVKCLYKANEWISQKSRSITSKLLDAMKINDIELLGNAIINFNSTKREQS
ncbi:hypothetical protein SAMN04244560_01249 [Thermoanaerobacter thermohydrosulfuricus]|uniref:Uncharacterized protein n=1 Tax=Thermoanaerobacter thermohydrosulfuricus TaxID=1516 RepID=A0A1G7P060_THETY|nr:hypothetical protein [Thermoanaerobacter thermohydrosulfuricus]SDF79621.1 hypothetical protein SAMN04244560_01249 [Thermoanaerobacter thermohydrosulfuricus]